MIYWKQIDEFNEPNWEKVGTQKRECAGRAAIDAYNVRGSFAANGFVSTKLFGAATLFWRGKGAIRVANVSEAGRKYLRLALSPRLRARSP